MIAALAAAAALGATPGGFRAPLGVAAPFVTTRQVVVPPSQAPWVAQTTVHAQAMVAGPFGVAAELPVLRTWQPGWSDTGIGQLRLGVRRFSGPITAPVALVAELALPVAPTSWRVSAWGSAARETRPGVEALLGLELAAHPASPTTVRLALGVRQGPYLVQDLGPPHWVGDVAVAQVLPVIGPMSLVAEAEVVRDLTPVSGRGLLRLDVDASAARWSVDLGAQLPVVAVVEGRGGLQAIGQVRWLPDHSSSRP